ncbi:Outer membrane receptor proteins, mostly Fe transport [Saccharicrinis carchari]|uniref:Outer membrane receptor proteins, mostly Fe transport n=1 Tax=Saccharicrinis carchari TaxID=1168039 RepID=A0A521B7M1_SACCC|nr:TonB-dependent receptor plug domain-containing protein [Saccharicrinis carchari]SMO43089.1 Outer membrane receptor proteins, mostly Fe transport [Saccharicrinis carchari]
MATSRIIKVFIVTILVFTGVPDMAYSQSILNRYITLDKKTGSTSDLLKEIETHTHIAFSYSNKVCISDSLQLSASHNTIQGFLHDIFADCAIQLIEKKNKIIILPGEVESPKIHVISGFVKNISNGEVLIGSAVYDALLWKGTTTNNFGFYSLSLAAGEVVLNCSFVGYHPVQKLIDLKSDTTINFNLLYNTHLKEVPVIGRMSQESINTTRTSTINVPIEQIQKFPSFLGEVDVIKTLQLLPGINSGNEGVGGLFVRGGSVDQNLYLLDDVPVYNISHLFGFFSVFNADALNNITVTKGGFPARYGGRLSSVIDIRMKDGNNSKLKGTVSIGMMSSKLALDGPLYKDKTTFSLSLRRSYFDVFAMPIQSQSNTRTAFYFYDTNAKISHRLSDKSKLYLSFYGGRDKFYSKYNYAQVRNPKQPSDGKEMLKVNDQSYSGWGNVVGSLRWNRIYSEKLFSNISLSFSNYKYFVGYEEHVILPEQWSYFEQKYRTGISDAMSKANFDYFMNPNHHVRFGASYTQHMFNPGVDLLRRTQNTTTVLDSTFGDKNVYGHEMFLYLEDDFKLSERLKMNLGVHLSLYHTKNKTYNSFQPRLSARLLLAPTIALKAAYSKMTQYMHLLGSSSVSLPTDLWVPVTDQIKPQHTDQYALGLKWQFRPGFDFSVEGYYKHYYNLLASVNNRSNISSKPYGIEEMTYGAGYSKGLEFLIHKKTGDLTGWLGYSLSKSRQKFSALNQGREFPSSNDRAHSIGVFSNYRFNKRVDLGLTWSFGTGSTVTLPSQKFFIPDLPTQGTTINNNYAEYVGEINNYRMPKFHRLDVGVNFKKENKLGERTWSVGLYNAYGNQNAFSVYFSSDVDENTGQVSRKLKQLSIFPVPLPYIRYTLRF